MRLFIFIVAMFVFAHSNAEAKSCTQKSSVCVDSVPCKTISGRSVCLSDVGLSCWKYEKTFLCLEPNAVNYCQAFKNQSQCFQTNSTCVQMDTQFGSGCMKYTQTWRCGDPLSQTPSNTIKLDDTYTLVSSGYDPGPCQSLASSGACTIAESKCISTTPPALPPGISPSQVAPDGCYQKQETYTCFTGASDTSDCGPYASNPKCKLQSTEPCEPGDLIKGVCPYQDKTYKCVTKDEEIKKVLDCSGQALCQGGNCFDTGYEPDKDFGPAMALLEAARQAGVYGSEASIFSGFAESCRIRLFGLGNCCKKSSKGGTKNNNLAFKLAAEVGSTTLEFGSRYMYDALFTRQTNILVDSGMGAMLGGVAPDSMLASFTPSIGLYGFSVSIGAPTAGFVTQALGGSVYALGSIPGTNMVFGFDPYTFVIAIVIQVIMEMMSCEEDELILAMKKGQNLCVSFGKYCSKKVLGSCMERKESSCCFNSRLARIINEQGRAQLGKGWGSQKSPDCSGFTAAELEKLDFSKIDLSEFIAEIMGSIKLPNLDGVSQNIQGVVQDKMQNYYERGNQMPAPQQP